MPVYGQLGAFYESAGTRYSSCYPGNDAVFLSPCRSMLALE